MLYGWDNDRGGYKEMREIKFRGKSIDARYSTEEYYNKMVYGQLIQRSGEFYILTNYGSEFLVDTESIGQYTGEQDCNGIEIYEIDIVMCKDYDGDEYVSLIQFEDGAFVVDVNNCDYDKTSLGWGINSDIESVRVIGNKYENPKLLEQNNE